MEHINIFHNDSEVLKKRKKNICSRLLFCWTLPVFVKGLQKDLNLQDLHGNLKKYDSHALGDKLEKEWECQKEYTDLTLQKIIIKLFGLRIFSFGFILFVAEFIKQVNTSIPAKITVNQLFCRILQPFCLGKIMQFYACTDKTTISQRDLLIYGGVLVATCLVNVVLMQHYNFLTLLLGMNIRVACCSLIYRKSLQLTGTTSGMTVGQLVNLLSNDVNRFDKAVTYLHYLWIPPLQLIVVTCLMYDRFGYLSVTGVLIMVLFIPLQSN